MNIPEEVLELRERFFTKGDNQEIARLASNGKKKYNAGMVYDSARNRRGDKNLIETMFRYYTAKRKMIKSIKKSTVDA